MSASTVSAWPLPPPDLPDAGFDFSEPGTLRIVIFATGPLPPIAGRTCAASTSSAFWIVNP
jgi:hypothetical protein